MSDDKVPVEPRESVARLDRALALFEQGLHELRIALRDEKPDEGLVPIARRAAVRSGRGRTKASRRAQEPDVTQEEEVVPEADTSTGARGRRARSLKAAHEQSAETPSAADDPPAQRGRRRG